MEALTDSSACIDGIPLRTCARFDDFFVDVRDDFKALAARGEIARRHGQRSCHRKDPLFKVKG